MSKFESIPQKLLTPLGDINILDSLIPCRFRIDLHSSERAKTLVALWHDLIIVFFSKSILNLTKMDSEFQAGLEKGAKFDTPTIDGKLRDIFAMRKLNKITVLFRKLLKKIILPNYSLV